MPRLRGWPAFAAVFVLTACSGGSGDTSSDGVIHIKPSLLQSTDRATWPSFPKPKAEGEFDMLVCVMNAEDMKSMVISATVKDDNGTRKIWDGRVLPKGIAERGPNPTPERVDASTCLALVRVKSAKPTLTVTNSDSAKATMQVDVEQENQRSWLAIATFKTIQIIRMH